MFLFHIYGKIHLGMHDGNERYRDAITVKPHFPNDNLQFSGAEGRISRQNQYQKHPTEPLAE